MFEALAQKFRGLKQIYERAPWIALGIIIGMSLALIAVGKAFEPIDDRLKALTTLEHFFVLLGQGARLVLLGGIVAAITRMFALTGFFRTALSDIVEPRLISLENTITQAKASAEFVGRAQPALSGEPTTVEEIWQEASRRILLPGFTLATEKDKEFSASVSEALRRMIDVRVNYYVTGMQRTITLTSFNEQTGILSLEDRTQYEVIPFKPEEPTTIKMRFIAPVGHSIQQYKFVHPVFKVDGNDMLPEMKVDPTTPVSDYVIPIQLKGRPRYQIERLTSIDQPIDTDPYFIFSPEFVCTSIALEIRSLVPGVSMIFEELAVEGAFRPTFQSEEVASAPATLHFSTTGTILPSQGFIIILTRRSR